MPSRPGRAAAGAVDKLSGQVNALSGATCAVHTATGNVGDVLVRFFPRLQCIQYGTIAPVEWPGRLFRIPFCTKKYPGNLPGYFVSGSGRRIRTLTNGVRVRCATITQFRYAQMILYKTFSICQEKIFNFPCAGAFHAIYTLACIRLCAHWNSISDSFQKSAAPSVLSDFNCTAVSRILRSGSSASAHNFARCFT